MNEMFITIGFYSMYAYTYIQRNIWVYCLKDSILMYWIRILIYQFRSHICSYNIEPIYPYMCICYNETEKYIPLESNLLPSTFLATDSDSEQERLLIMRNCDHIISRIFRNNVDISLVKSRKHFLSVEYTHPDMSNRIFIELDPKLYLIGNEILSSRFVLRYLQYQPEYYVFDDKYVLNIMDSRIRMFTLSSSEYIVIDNTEYEKKSIKI